jgi:hypothetical protein
MDIVRILERAKKGCEANWWDGTAENVFKMNFCIGTALGAATEYNGEYWRLAQAAFEQANNLKEGVIRFNDSHTHAEVLAAFDKAIDYAKNSN